MPEKYIPKKCPDCGKHLLDYYCTYRAAVHIWCKHCHELKEVFLEPTDVEIKSNS